MSSSRSGSGRMPVGTARGAGSGPGTSGRARRRIAPQSAPGSGAGPVAVHPRAAEPAPETLRQALASAVESVVVGELLRPSLVGSAETAARQVLLRRGIRDARVQARIQGGGISLMVILPAGPSRVRQVVLEVGAGAPSGRFR